MPAKPTNIDEYLESVSPDRRSALERLRKTIHSIIPECEECISYSMPAFRFGGYVVAGFLATRTGCSYFPFSGSTLTTLATEIAKYQHTKSALHFDPSHPLPTSLLKKLIRVRILENPNKVGKPRTAEPGMRRAPTSAAPKRRSKTGR